MTSNKETFFCYFHPCPITRKSLYSLLLGNHSTKHRWNLHDLLWDRHENFNLATSFLFVTLSLRSLLPLAKQKTVFSVFPEFPPPSWLFMAVVWTWLTAESLGLAGKCSGVIVNYARQKANWSIVVLSAVTYKTYWSSCMSCWCTCAWNSLCYSSHLSNARVLTPSGYSLSLFTFDQSQ